MGKTNLQQFSKLHFHHKNLLSSYKGVYEIYRYERPYKKATNKDINSLLPHISFHACRNVGIVVVNGRDDGEHDLEQDARAQVVQLTDTQELNEELNLLTTVRPLLPSSGQDLVEFLEHHLVIDFCVFGKHLRFLLQIYAD